jgi:hypothetical protein
MVSRCPCTLLARPRKCLDQASGTYRRLSPPQTHRAALPGRYGGSKLRSSLTDSLARALCARGFSKAVMVELTGLEPVTPALPVRCATSCATAPKRSPRDSRGA